MVNEIPYSKIDPREMQDLEAEFGRTLTPELAQCLIRYRINRDAIELMLRRGPGSSSITELLERKQGEPNSEDSEGEGDLASGFASGFASGQSGRGAGRMGTSAARKAVA